MSTLELIRYWLALIFVVAWPAGFSIWFVIHPFAAGWQRAGPVWAYASAAAVALLIGAAVILVREPLLSVEFGAHPLMLGTGGLLLVVAQILDLWVLRYLRFPVLVGLPELRANHPASGLLTAGPYALVRHPRYSTLMLGLFGVALVSNYLAIHLLAVLMLPLINLLARLEERELIKRFGDDYRRYAEQTPRFIPRPGRVDRA